MRPRSLILVALLATAAPTTLSRPLLAADDKTTDAVQQAEEARKADQARHDSEIRKSFEELKVAVQKLADQISDQADGDTQEATSWVRARLAELQESLNSAGDRLEEETGAAGEDARKKTGDLLKGLADAVGSLGDTVAKNKSGEGDAPAADPKK